MTTRDIQFLAFVKSYDISFLVRYTKRIWFINIVDEIIQVRIMEIALSIIYTMYIELHNIIKVILEVHTIIDRIGSRDFCNRKCTSLIYKSKCSLRNSKRTIACGYIIET